MWPSDAEGQATLQLAPPYNRGGAGGDGAIGSRLAFTDGNSKNNLLFFAR